MTQFEPVHEDSTSSGSGGSSESSEVACDTRWMTMWWGFPLAWTVSLGLALSLIYLVAEWTGVLGQGYRGGGFADFGSLGVGSALAGLVACFVVALAWFTVPSWKSSKTQKPKNARFVLLLLLAPLGAGSFAPGIFLAAPVDIIPDANLAVLSAISVGGLALALGSSLIQTGLGERAIAVGLIGLSAAAVVISPFADPGSPDSFYFGMVLSSTIPLAFTFLGAGWMEPVHDTGSRRWEKTARHYFGVVLLTVGTIFLLAAAWRGLHTIYI